MAKGFGRRMLFVGRNPLPLDSIMFVSQLVFWLPDHPVIHCLPTAISRYSQPAAVTCLNVCESRSPVTAAGPRRIHTVFRLLETALILIWQESKSSACLRKIGKYSPPIVFHLYKFLLNLFEWKTILKRELQKEAECRIF